MSYCFRDTPQWYIFNHGLVTFYGAHPGRNLLPPNSRNPKGFFESKKIVALNNKLFLSLGYRWDSLELLPDDWVSLPSIQALKSELIEVFYSEFDTGQLL